MTAGPATSTSKTAVTYLQDNVERAYHIFKLNLYLNVDEVPTRENPEMEEQLYQLLSDKNALLHSELLKHILNSFWALDLMDVEQDAEGLRDLLDAPVRASDDPSDETAAEVYEEMLREAQSCVQAGSELNTDSTDEESYW